MLTLWQ